MDVLWKNLVYSVRMLLKKPGLTAIAIIAMGLGIGANTAIFSVVNTVLLQPLPYEQPEQLVMLATEQRNQALDGRGSFSVPDLLDVQQRSTTLEYVATVQADRHDYHRRRRSRTFNRRRSQCRLLPASSREANTRPRLHARRRQTRRSVGGASESGFVATPFWRRSKHHWPRDKSRRKNYRDRHHAGRFRVSH